MGLTACEVHYHRSAKWAQTEQTKETRQTRSSLCPSMVVNTVESDLFSSLKKTEMANDYICRWDILKNTIFLPHRRILFFRVHQRQKEKKMNIVYAYVRLSTTISD